MQNWKSILQSNYLIYILLIMASINVLASYLVIPSSKYSLEEKELEGTVYKKKIDGDSLTVTLHSKELVAVTYKLKSEEERNHYLL